MITVCHIEELPIIQVAIQDLCSQDGYIRYISGENNLENLEPLLKSEDADVLVLDIDCARGEYKAPADYLKLCKDLIIQFPETGIVIHSRYKHPGWIEKFQFVGVLGFVSKYSTGLEVIAAIKSVNLGKSYMCPLIAEIAIRGNALQQSAKSGRLLFSYREMQILQQLRAGKSTKEIASELNIAIKTVETHRKNLIDKAHAKNTAELIQVAAEMGY